MSSITIHVDNNDSALIFCKSCGELKKASFSKFKNVRHRITAKCTCGEHLDIKLNFRRYYRKDVSIPGKFLSLKPDTDQWTPMKVLDLSMYGLRIETFFAASPQKDDVIRVKFSLEGKKAITVEKKAKVIHVNNGALGCEFVDLALEEKELGFFLLK